MKSLYHKISDSSQRHGGGGGNGIKKGIYYACYTFRMLHILQSHFKMPYVATDLVTIFEFYASTLLKHYFKL